MPDFEALYSNDALGMAMVCMSTLQSASTDPVGSTIPTDPPLVIGPPCFQVGLMTSARGRAKKLPLPLMRGEGELLKWHAHLGRAGEHRYGHSKLAPLPVHAMLLRPHMDRVCCIAVRGGSSTAAVAVGHERGVAITELLVELAVEVSLHALAQGPEGLEVHYTPAADARGAVPGELTALQVDRGQKLAGFKAQLAELLEVPERKLRLSLPGGSRWVESEQ